MIYRAARFYDRAARYYHKEYAHLNFPEDETFPTSIEDLRKELKWNKK